MAEPKPMLKLRATVTIDIDAIDYMDAARYQQEMEALCADLGRKYVAASYELRERRDRGEPTPTPKRATSERPTRRSAPRTRKPKKESETSSVSNEQEAQLSAN